MEKMLGFREVSCEPATRGGHYCKSELGLATGSFWLRRASSMILEMGRARDSDEAPPWPA